MNSLEKYLEKKEKSKSSNKQKNNIITFVFEVTKQKAVDFSFISETEAKKYPVYEHYLREVQQSLVVYQYKPGAKFSQEDYIKYLTRKIKRKYNAYSVLFLGSKMPESKISNN